MRRNAAAGQRLTRNLEGLARWQHTDVHANSHLGGAILSDIGRTIVHNSRCGRLIIAQTVRDLATVDLPEVVRMKDRYGRAPADPAWSALLTAAIADEA